MNHLIVDADNELKEVETSGPPIQPAPIRFAAKVISYIFHPIFIPVYVTWFLVYIQPYLFSGFDDWGKKVAVIQAAVMYILFPLATVLLLKGLGFIKTIQLKSQTERIIPYVASMIFYFWAWYVSFNLPDTPKEIVALRLAIFIACIIGFMANIYFKISMHAIAVALAATFILTLAFTEDFQFGLYVSIAVFVAGLVSTARLAVSDHSPFEIYAGLLAGIISQIIAFQLV
jgi:hypothetical protein